MDAPSGKSQRGGGGVSGKSSSSRLVSARKSSALWRRRRRPRRPCSLPTRPRSRDGRAYSRGPRPPAPRFCSPRSKRHEAAAAGLRHDAHDLAVHRVRGALQVAVVVAQAGLQLAVEGRASTLAPAPILLKCFESCFWAARCAPQRCPNATKLASDRRGTAESRAVRGEAAQQLSSTAQREPTCAHKGLNPQAEQLGACDTRVQGVAS